MAKYKITNVSQKSTKGARNVFLVEVGRLLKPGDHCVANRLDSGTGAMAEAGVLKIEEGNFVKPPLFTEDAPTTPATQAPPPAPVEKKVVAVATPKPEPLPAPKPLPEPEPVTIESLERDSEKAEPSAASTSSSDDSSEKNRRNRKSSSPKLKRGGRS